MKVVLKKWALGDWTELWMGNVLFYEGHSVPDRVWMDALECYGQDGIETEFEWVEETE